MENLLEIKNISLTYNSPKSETLAIKDLSFDVKNGEFVSIVGPSGCGKTTLLSLIAGLIKQTDGQISFAKESSCPVGYMFQRDNLFEWLTIWKNVCLGFSFKKRRTKENIAYAKSLIEKYGLKDFVSHYPGELSGGMRQRVALIRTLCLRPDLLLLDEPFSALDYQTRLAVQDDVYEIIKREKKTAILVTHDIYEAIAMSTRIIVLSSRPATIKKIIDLNFDQNLTPFERRKQPNFQAYFDEIWEDLK